MSIRLSRLATGIFMAAAMLLMSGRSWAIYYDLGPSNDEWGLKYDVEVNPADGDMATVVFTLADEGRLKPVYSTEVVAFSAPDSSGGRSYLVKAPIKVATTPDGRREGHVQIPKQLADRAMIRILTLNVNGQRQRSASYYDIPLKEYLNKAPTAASPITTPPQPPPSIAAPPTSKVTN